MHPIYNCGKKAFEKIWNLPEEDIITLGISNDIPIFPLYFAEGILGQVFQQFKDSQPLIDLSPPLIVVGDLHGNLHDLLRIFHHHDPTTNKFLFLGDYVDRGNYSTEVILLLFLLKIFHPNNINLLRGNHEFSGMNSGYGFRNEIIETYGSDILWTKINNVFSYLPFVATVGSIFCVHGGISKTLENLDDLKNIKLPIFDYQDPLIADLVWSDPADFIALYYTSLRGYGNVFGQKAVAGFYEKTGFKKIIRGHECILEGVTKKFNSVWTVFSSSFYSEDENHSGWLLIDDNYKIHPRIINPFRSIHRSKAKKKEMVVRRASNSSIQFGISKTQKIDMRNASFPVFSIPKAPKLIRPSIPRDSTSSLLLQVE